MLEMPLSVNWYDNEHSIIIVTITVDTTWSEYDQAVDWIVTESSKVDHRVDLIFHDNVGMPKGNPMPHLKRGSAKIVEQPNIYYSIIAGTQGASGFGQMILGALAKTYMKLSGSARGRGEILFMRSLEEALAQIQKHRIHSSVE
jgi:hypothetical protein